jgi:DNA-binding transcriptional LysR family regulator
MEFRQIRYFVEVAKHLHFTRAAGSLRVAQPAVSQQIRRLERELGVELFERTSGGVRLTEAGSTFLTRAQRVLGEVSLAEKELRELAGAMRGRVVLGTFQYLADLDLPALLTQFHAEHPDIEVVVREQMADQLLLMLCNGELDLVIAYLDEARTTPGLSTEPLYSEELVAVTSHSHPLSARRGVSFGELRGEPFIMPPLGSGLRRIIDRATAAESFEPKIAFESGELRTIRALAAQGLGVTVLPRSVAQSDGPKIGILPFLPGPLTRTVSLTWREGEPFPPAASAFLAFSRRNLLSEDRA